MRRLFSVPEILVYILEAMAIKKKIRNLFLFFIFLLLFSAYLDSLDVANAALEFLSELLMVLSASGLIVTQGALLYYAVSSREDGKLRYYFVSIAWIFLGIVIITIYLVEKIRYATYG